MTIGYDNILVESAGNFKWNVIIENMAMQMLAMKCNHLQYGHIISVMKYNQMEHGYVILILRNTKQSLTMLY